MKPAVLQILTAVLFLGAGHPASQPDLHSAQPAAESAWQSSPGDAISIGDQAVSSLSAVKAWHQAIRHSRMPGPPWWQSSSGRRAGRDPPTDLV